MERITIRKNRKTYLNSELFLVDGVTDIITKVLDRLAAYENTGLTPESVAELAQADREGRLLVMPYTVGDKIWIRKSDHEKDKAHTEELLERS